MGWMQANSNVHTEPDGSKWGGSCSYILGPDGQMCNVLSDNQQPTYSAGYGGAGSTWAIDEYGVSYEWAQPASQPPFSDAMYRRGAKEIAVKCKKYGIPPVFLNLPNQSGPVPKGIVRHDRCANGVKLGKTDPGPQFNEALFLQYLNAELQEDDMTPEQEKKLDRAVAAAEKANAWLEGDIDPAAGIQPRIVDIHEDVQVIKDKPPGALSDAQILAIAQKTADILAERLKS
jgi:hypothetical protein